MSDRLRRVRHIIIGLMFLFCLGVVPSQAGEVNIVAFGGLYNAFGASASISDSPSSREADQADFADGEIYGVRLEGFSTRVFSGFFGFGLEASYFERGYTLETQDTGFRKADIKSEIIQLGLSMLFRRPSGALRPYLGTGLSILIVEQSIRDQRNEATGLVIENSTLQVNDNGWHFLGGLKWFPAESLYPPGFPARFFLMGEARYLVSNITADGKTFGSLKDQLNGSFFVGGFGINF